MDKIIDTLYSLGGELNMDSKSIAKVLLENTNSELKHRSDSVELRNRKELLERVIREIDNRIHASIDDILNNL